MGNKIRTYDKNTLRKTNKEFHQFEKNIFEKNYFTYVAIVKKIIDANWVKVKLIPTPSINEFELSEGYTNSYVENSLITVYKSGDVKITLNNIVLVAFTDVNSKRTLKDLLKGKKKTQQFTEIDQTRHSINFGIIINRLTPEAEWTDLNFPLNQSRVGKNLKPDWDDIQLGLLFPRNGATEYIDIICQMPHGWKEGSDVNPHVHMIQKLNQQAVFKYDYVWYNVGDQVPTVWTTVTMNKYAIPYTSGNLAQIVEAQSFLSGAGKRISSILKIRLYRDDNVYAGDVLADQFDIHYQIDSNGSILEFIKQEFV
jgi:hypothetical protein